MIIAVSGLVFDPNGNKGSAGAGKSTVTDRLVANHKFVEVAFADVMKRFCMELFGFSEQQLWGPSEFRNAPDARYLLPSKVTYPQAPEGAVWIPLVNGRGYALIDAADYAAVSQVSWRLNKKPNRRTNYASCEVQGRAQKLHQFLIPDVAPGCVIDHINGDGLDNRRVNLRVCTQAENHANEHKRLGGTSVFKGVSFDLSRNKWSAKISVSGETRNLGRFDREVDAAVAYDKAAREAFGAHARTNAELFLTPRRALQLLGTEWARNGCFPDIWVAYGMRVAERIQEGELYDKVTGVRYFPKVDSMLEVKKNVVFSDMRFKNEFDYIRKNGGKLVRVRRPVEKLAVSSAHQSENDLNDVPDEAFDYVIHGQPADVPDLQLRTDEMMDWLTGRIRNFDEKQADVPPFLRNS